MLRSRFIQTLNVPKGYASGQDTAALTNSAARTNVVLLIRRIVFLAATLLDRLFEHPARSVSFSREIVLPASSHQNATRVLRVALGLVSDE
jgi:hypothetical protein